MILLLQKAKANEEEKEPCPKIFKKMKRDWSAPNCFNTFENFELFKVDVIGRFKDQRTNKYTCNICPVNPSFHNMPRKYFKCDNTDCDCEVEEPDCVCFKCTAEMKVETCTYTQKTRMAATGKHLKSCYEATKTGFSLGTKKVIDKVKRQHSGVPNFGASKVRDALLDEGFSKADLPPVKQIQIYLNSKKSQVHPATTLKGFKTNSPKWDQCMQGKVMILLFLLCMQGNSQWNSIFLGCWWWRNKWKEATMWRRPNQS